MNMLMQPTNTTESTNLPYFCMGELNLSIMQKVSEIITNPNYQPFKRKTKKNAQTVIQYYVSNSPHTDHAFYYLQSIHPISTPLLQHTAFNISQSVKAINQAYTNLGYVSDGPINPTLLHNEHYVEQIKSVVDTFVYELKNHSTSKSAIADRDNRIALIKEIRKANAPVMKKLFKTQQRFNLNHFIYTFNMEKCELHDKAFLERELAKQISNMIEQFHENHQSEILALFFCVQRNLSNNYVLNVYCATDLEYEKLSMKDCIQLRNGNYMIVAPTSNISLSTEEFNYPMDLQGADGINEKTWKAIFGEILFKYNYFYYETEYVSPKFIYRKCDSNH